MHDKGALKQIVEVWLCQNCSGGGKKLPAALTIRLVGKDGCDRLGVHGALLQCGRKSILDSIVITQADLELYHTADERTAWMRRRQVQVRDPSCVDALKES